MAVRVSRKEIEAALRSAIPHVRRQQDAGKHEQDREDARAFFIVHDRAADSVTEWRMDDLSDRKKLLMELMKGAGRKNQAAARAAFTRLADAEQLKRRLDVLHGTLAKNAMGRALADLKAALPACMSEANKAKAQRVLKEVVHG